MNRVSFRLILLGLLSSDSVICIFNSLDTSPLTRCWLDDAAGAGAAAGAVVTLFSDKGEVPTSHNATRGDNGGPIQWHGVGSTMWLDLRT